MAKSPEFLKWYEDIYLADPSLKDSTPTNLCKSIQKVTDNKQKELAKTLKNLMLEFDEDGVTVPDQSASNTKFLGERTDASRHVIVDGDKVVLASPHRGELIKRGLDLLIRICEEEEYITVRNFFYMDKELFSNQASSDKVIDQISARVGCSRSSLSVFPSFTGSIIGPVSYMLEDKVRVDCNYETQLKHKFGVRIRPFLQDVSSLTNDGALFLLIVEKYSTFIDVIQHNFHITYNCIIMTGDGMAYAPTRGFLKFIMDKLRIPAFTLTDCDPWGLQISTVYSHASENLAYDSKNLACPLINWLGIWPTDLDLFDIATQDLTKGDLKKVDQKLKKDCIESNPFYTEQLKYMQENRKKAGLESLKNNDNTRYLCEVYLPKKLYELRCLIMEGKIGKNDEDC